MRNYDVEWWEETAEQIENNIREDISLNLWDVLLDSGAIDDFITESISDSIPLDCEDTHADWIEDVLREEIRKDLGNKIYNALKHF